jgi:hypothetical protein
MYLHGNVKEERRMRNSGMEAISVGTSVPWRRRRTKKSMKSPGR